MGRLPCSSYTCLVCMRTLHVWAGAHKHVLSARTLVRVYLSTQHNTRACERLLDVYTRLKSIRRWVATVDRSRDRSALHLRRAVREKFHFSMSYTYTRGILNTKWKRSGLPIESRNFDRPPLPLFSHFINKYRIGLKIKLFAAKERRVSLSDR